jgi:dimethylamine monooxygenase subunit A
MLKYFPFQDKYDLKMGTLPLQENEHLIETDSDYLSEISAKRKLLTSEHEYYYRSKPGTIDAQWEVLEKVLTSLVNFDPQHFKLERLGNEWTWINEKLEETHTFIFGQTDTLPFEPLDWVGRQVQEDIIILSNDDTTSLCAGQLCLPNGWCLDDKFGKTFLGIHQPAPKMIGSTMNAAHKVMGKIIANKTLWRASWNFKITNQLDMSSKFTKAYNEELKEIAPQLNEENIGEKIFIRIERQTITKLEKSGCVLFGIHTYQSKLADEVKNKVRSSQIVGTLKTTPREMLNYKAISPFENVLLRYVEAFC